FEDKNKDGSITIDYSGKTVDDRYDLDRSPKFDGGFTNSLSYKNWELTVFFYFKKQIGQNAFTSTDPAGALSGLGNQSEEVFNNHWQKPGDIAKYPKFTTMPYDISFQNFRYNSDGIFTDASFLRLQNVTVSYSLSEKDGKKVGLKKCKFYLSAQNLLLFTKFKGSDPELQSFGSLPIPKILTAGISCQF
ncbi:MAG TPA: hypothetical protein PLS50_08780, partial [Candidatus Dojkabacteria bacterium]|nr:hypothetical protein [Candidatus Dojkabacteria bacterium]